MKVILHSDEINLLIYRYLQESGFFHTAFTFCAEANLGRSVAINSSCTSIPSNSKANGSLLDQLGPRLPPNCLVSLLHKALLYCWIEHHTDPETAMEIPCDQPFGLFSRHTCRVDEKPVESNTDDDDDEDIVSKKVANEASSLRTRFEKSRAATRRSKAPGRRNSKPSIQSPRLEDEVHDATTQNDTQLNDKSTTTLPPMQPTVSPMDLSNCCSSKTPPAPVNRLSHEFHQDSKEYASSYNYEHQTPSPGSLTATSNNLIQQESQPGQTTNTTNT